MFRNSLIGSLILHVLFLIGANFLLTDNAVSKAVPIDKKMPICIELAGEPFVVKDSSGNDENRRIRQPKGFLKRPSDLRVTKGIPTAAAAKVADSLPKTPAEAGKSTTEPQTSHDKRPDKSTKVEAGPAVDVKKPDAGPGAGQPRGNGAGVGGGDDSKNPGPTTGTGGPEGVDSGSGGRSLIYAPRPLYPLQARRNNWEGAVLLEIGIGSDGRVQKETVLQSSGYPVLDQAAQKAIQKWRYRPARKNGVAVASQLRVRVKFCLTDWED